MTAVSVEIRGGTVNEPKVFSPGTLTISASMEAITLACGHVDVGFIRSMSLTFDSETKSVKAVVEFYKSHHEGTALRIEEAMRSVRSLGWVEVKN